MNRPAAQPLSRLPTGTEATVVALAGGRGFQGRLVSMGLSVGRSVRVVRSSNGAGGPTLIALGQTRLAIGRGMADRILVSPPARPPT
jgi:Fe2+ transport system protein FeoA